MARRLPSPVRRFAAFGVSVLILVHFTAITSAVLANPPGPWVAMQSQHLIFRPYLAFMYLNNAYRFYSPEPGPSQPVVVSHRIQTRQRNPFPLDETSRYRRRGRQQLRDQRAVHSPACHDRFGFTHLAPALDDSQLQEELQLAPCVEARQEQMPKPLEKPLGFKAPPKSLEVPMHLYDDDQLPTSNSGRPGNPVVFRSIMCCGNRIPSIRMPCRQPSRFTASSTSF